MTRDEAVAAAQERNADPTGVGFWAAQERDGAWEVVEVRVDGLAPNRPTGIRTEARDQPEVQDDPRPNALQHFPPHAAG